jgi:hypothetical protein
MDRKGCRVGLKTQVLTIVAFEQDQCFFLLNGFTPLTLVTFCRKQITFYLGDAL